MVSLLSAAEMDGKIAEPVEYKRRARGDCSHIIHKFGLGHAWATFSQESPVTVDVVFN